MLRHPAVVVIVVLLLYLMLLAWVWWGLGKGSETLNFTTAYFLFANFIVVWWYAWLTRDLVEISRTGASAATDQAKLARARAVTEQKQHWRERKPLVFTFARAGHLWISNVGGGPALNVYYLNPAIDHRPMGLGALGVGQERQMLPGFGEPSGVWRHVLVAEGVAPRTRRWNPTVNVGIDTNLTAHEIGPLHQPLTMGDDTHWTLDVFLEKNREKLLARLAEVPLPASM
jgi:hypothetical protein